MLHLVGCLYYCINDTRSHKHQILVSNLKQAVLKKLCILKYSLDLAPCDFFLFPKMKLKDAGSIPLRRSRSNRRECLTLWQKRTSRKRYKNGGDFGAGVYMRERTTSSVTAVFRPYGEFYEFYSVSPENFESTLVHISQTCCNIYTECNRRKVRDFGRVFLMLNYTDITQNISIQSWLVTEIMAGEVWNFDSCYSLIDYQIHIETGRNMWFL